MELVFLHGAAASGKLTTARALERLLGFPVFHNHLTVDLLTTVFPFGSEPFVRLREQFWTSVFADAARIERSIVFTFAPECTVRRGFPARARQVVEAAGGRVCFVRLLVSEAEQERRIDSDSRRQFHKLTDIDTLRALRTDDDMVEQPPVDLQIDTDTSDAERSAATIAAHFHLVPQTRVGRYGASDPHRPLRCRSARRPDASVVDRSIRNREASADGPLVASSHRQSSGNEVTALPMRRRR